MHEFCLDFTNLEAISLLVMLLFGFALGYLVAAARSHNGNGVK